MPAARGGPPRVHVLDRERDAGRLLEGRDALDEPGGVLLLPAERRVHDDHVGADRVRHLGERSSLPHGSVPQTRWVNSRQGAWTAQTGISWWSASCLTADDLLAERVDADHHLDGVVAEPRGVARRRARSTRGRPRRSRARSAGRTRRSAPRRDRVWSMPLEDHALAQRPRADLELRRGRRCPCTPRRPARPATIWWVAARRDAGQPAQLVGDHRDQLGDPVAQVRGRERRAATSGPSPEGAAPQIRASDRNVLDVATARSGAPPRSSWPGVAGDLGADLLAQRADRPRRRAGRRRSTRGPAGPRPAAPTRRRRAPRRRRRRSPASRRRCRRRPAGRPTSRTSGVRRGRSAGPRPRRTAPRCRRRSLRRTWSSTSSELAASRTAEVANAEHLLAALVLGDDDATTRRTSVSASMPSG